MVGEIVNVKKNKTLKLKGKTFSFNGSDNFSIYGILSWTCRKCGHLNSTKVPGKPPERIACERCGKYILERDCHQYNKERD